MTPEKGETLRLPWITSFQAKGDTKVEPKISTPDLRGDSWEFEKATVAGVPEEKAVQSCCSQQLRGALSIQHTDQCLLVMQWIP